MTNTLTKWLAHSLLLLLSAACSSEENVPTTTVQGIVINKSTGQPVVGIPITVIRYFAGMSGYRGDSLTGATTDATGQYSLTFPTESAGYRIRLTNQNEYSDLKNSYDSHVELELGITNEYNFEVTPYKMITVHGTGIKDGKSSIDFYCVTTNQGRAKYDCGTLFIDTVRAHQTVSFTRTVRVVPNLEYQFKKSIYNQDRRDYSFAVEVCTIEYDDTARIYLR